MPKYHAEVLWDLGIDLSAGSGFSVNQRDKYRSGKVIDVGNDID